MASDTQPIQQQPIVASEKMLRRYANAAFILLKNGSWCDTLQIIGGQHRFIAISEAKEAGVNKFVSKPLFISDLKRTLTELINDSKNIDEENDCESFKGYKILLVEDNILNQEIANQILIDHGFEVTIAQNGLEAIDILKLNDPEKYNLILMDIQMPIMDGYEATRRIKKMKNKTIRNIPIVAMTANAFDEDIKESLEAGMVDHLSKPFEIKKLIEVLKNNLKQ